MMIRINSMRCFALFSRTYKNSGYLGASLCMILSSWGSAWGTWKAGLGVCHMGIDHPAGIIKNIVPIVMAGVLGIYGLIVSVIITQAVVPPNQNDHTNTYSTFNGYTHVSWKQCINKSIGRWNFDSHVLGLSNFSPILLLSFSFRESPVCCWTMLWTVLLGGWRYHWNSGRCWCSRFWNQGRKWTQMVLGRLGYGRRRWRRRCSGRHWWRKELGRSSQQTVRWYADYAHFFRSVGSVWFDRGAHSEPTQLCL